MNNYSRKNYLIKKEKCKNNDINKISENNAQNVGGSNLNSEELNTKINKPSIADINLNERNDKLYEEKNNKSYIKSNINRVFEMKTKFDNNLIGNKMIFKKDILNEVAILCKVKSVKEICESFKDEIIYKKNEYNLKKTNYLYINSNNNSVLDIKRKLENEIDMKTKVNDNLVCNQMIYKKVMLNDASLLCKVKSVKEICDNFQNELIYKKNESNLNKKNEKINSNYNSVLNIKRKLENTIHTVNDMHPYCARLKVLKRFVIIFKMS